MGIDIDLRAINYAKINMESKYQNSRFFTLEEFLKAGITMKADVVICFEVFELEKIQIGFYPPLYLLQKTMV